MEVTEADENMRVINIRKLCLFLLVSNKERNKFAQKFKQNLHDIAVYPTMFSEKRLLIEEMRITVAKTFVGILQQSGTLPGRLEVLCALCFLICPCALCAVVSTMEKEVVLVYLVTKE